jgi:hypothetical protein
MRRKQLATHNTCGELYGIIRHFFPELIALFHKVNDPRHQSYITYQRHVILFVRVLAVVFHIESMRKMTEAFDRDACAENVKNMLNAENLSELPHWSTINNYLEKLDPKEVEAIIHKLVSHLIRMRSFEGSRIRTKYWQIIVDGTQLYSFDKRHCPHCLTRKHKDKDGNVVWIEYYHYVLEAKLVLHGTIVVSIATEFVENERSDVSKQDCERNAFYRLAEKLKHRFPRLPICLSLDSLYACGPVFDLCRQNNWRYIIRFKDGSLPSVAEEFHTLKTMDMDHIHTQTVDGITKTYLYVIGIPYQTHTLNVIEYIQSDHSYPFVFITDLPISKHNYERLVEDGRSRWKIENEGFNSQKKQGYALEHVFSENATAMKNHYLLIQIGHMIAQFLEKGLQIWRTIKAPSYKVCEITKQAFQTTILSKADIQLYTHRRQFRFL